MGRVTAEERVLGGFGGASSGAWCDDASAGMAARLARLGFDEATLRDLNPDLVHLAISGYGPDGTAAERPGYDFVIQFIVVIGGDAEDAVRLRRH